MITIGIVDDDKDKRGTLLKALRRTINDDSINYVDVFPLPTEDEYLAWISHNRIDAIVMDWRLNEQSDGDQAPVKYQGDAIVKKLRSHLPYFPIFVLTAYAKDDDVDAHEAEVESIEDRAEFSKTKEVFASRLIRAASRFSVAREKKFSRVSELAKLCAVGKASAAEKKELNDLQSELHLSVASEIALTQSAVLDDAKSLVDDTAALIKKIEARLAEKKA